MVNLGKILKDVTLLLCNITLCNITLILCNIIYYYYVTLLLFPYWSYFMSLLKKAMAPHSNTLAWKIPWMEEPGGLQSMGSLPVRHDWATSLSCTGEGNGNPLQYSCLENPRGGGAWWAALYGVAESDTTEATYSSSSSSMSIELVVPSNHLILCRPLLHLPSNFPSIRVFSNEPALPIRWPKYWNYSFNISPSNEYWGLISFRMDWLRVQGTLKSLLKHHSLKASILQCSAFFIVQLSHHNILLK